MTKTGGKRRAESGAALRRSRSGVTGRPERSAGPLKAVGGRGLGKAGARRLGKMLKRVIQDDHNGKGTGSDQLPTTPIRLLKHKVQASEGRTRTTAPHLILDVISQCKRRGGMSMEELKQALAAGGYDVTKNNAKVKLAMKGLVRKETTVQSAGQGTSSAFNKKKPTDEKRGRTRAKRKKDAGKKSASKKPKPTGQYNKARQKKQRKRAKAAARSAKTARKGVKAQSRARGNIKKTKKAVTKTKHQSHRKQHPR